MQMEIERGVKIEEYGGDWEAGLSSGSRSMEQLPAYTEDEMEKELGDVSAEIERVFRRQPQAQGSEPSLAGAGTA